MGVASQRRRVGGWRRRVGVGWRRVGGWRWRREGWGRREGGRRRVGCGPVAQAVGEARELVELHEPAAVRVVLREDPGRLGRRHVDSEGVQAVAQLAVVEPAAAVGVEALEDRPDRRVRLRRAAGRGPVNGLRRDRVQVRVRVEVRLRARTRVNGLLRVGLELGLGLENSGSGACAGELGRPGYQGEPRGG